MSKETFLANYRERSKKLLLQCAAFATQSLSQEERDLVHRDLYGTSEVFEETDTLIDDKLSELEREINSMDDEDLTSAYREAVTLEKESCPYPANADYAKEEEEEKNSNKSYITSRNFKLLFLRAEHFHAPNAALRLTKYFREKLEIFGRDKLACKITQADLNDEDKAFLAAGCSINITAATDDHGRRIIFFRQQQLLGSSFSITTAKRVFFYLLQSAVEEHDVSQKKGFILVDYNMATKRVLLASEVTRFYPLIRMIQGALPFRLSALHFCYNSKVEHFFYNLACLVLTNYWKSRIQCHYEKTPNECIADLRAYGIKPTNLPITEDGEYRKDPFEDFLERLRQSEEQQCQENKKPSNNED